MKAIIYKSFVWVMSVLQSGGYAGVVLLMAMESSIFPVPSELVVPPAAYWASQGKMNMLGVILAGTLGSWIGASLTYLASSRLGRPLVMRYGKYILLSPRKFEAAEGWVRTYGTAGIFFARLLPVIRHFISIPAGLCHMNFAKFSLMTVLGSAIWCSVLAWFGPRVITPRMFDNAQEMVVALKQQTHWFVALVALMAVLYAIMIFLTRRNRKRAVAADPQ